MIMAAGQCVCEHCPNHRCVCKENHGNNNSHPLPASNIINVGGGSSSQNYSILSSGSRHLGKRSIRNRWKEWKWLERRACVRSEDDRKWCLGDVALVTIS